MLLKEGKRWTSIQSLYKEAIDKVIDESNPKEARKMVSNLLETLKKTYDDAVIAGKIEVAQNMLAKDMDEKLISEVSGLPMEQINTLKRNIGKFH